jgi:EmrB/QacA subfamily drug resistance transporter
MDKTPSTRWILMLPMSIGAFCAALDNNLLSVCLPSIIKDLNCDVGLGQFVNSSYTFAICSLLLTFGYLSNHLGRKRVFAFGTMLFSLSSLMSAFAPNVTVLIATRILQGVGAGMFMANGMALVTTHFDPSVRGRAFGILATAGAVASIIGPIVGGFIASTWSWRGAFLLVVLLGLAASFSALKLLNPEVKQDWRKSLAGFDYQGMLLSITTVLLLVTSLFYLRSQSWIIFATTLILTTISVMVFLRQQKRSANPILHAEVLSNRLFLSSNIMAFFIFAIMMGVGTTLPLHIAYQSSLSPNTAGLLLSLQAIPIFALSFPAGLLADKRSATMVAFIGTAMVLAGIALLTLAFHSEQILLAGAGSVVVGAGIGFFNPSNHKIVMSSVDKKYSSVAASVNVLFRNLGIALGTALAGIIYGVLLGVDHDLPVSPGVGTLLFFLMIALVLLVMSGWRGLNKSKTVENTCLESNLKK